MLQVSCPSCSAEYPLDAKRLPPKGLKMRCPQCGARFRVFKDGRVNSLEAAKPAPPPPPRAPVPRPGTVPKPRRAGGQEAVDADLPTPKKAGEIVDLPGPSQPKPPVPRPPKKPLAPPPSLGADDGVDLPAPRAEQPAFPSAAAVLDELDLPAPKRPVSKSTLPDPDDGVDLPAPIHHDATPDLEGVDLPTPRTAATAATAPDLGSVDLPRAKDSDDGVDLPAPASKGAPDSLDAPAPPPRAALEGIDLPSPKVKRAPIAPPVDVGVDLPAPKTPPPAPSEGRRPRRQRVDSLDFPAPIEPAVSRVSEPPPALADEDRNPFTDLAEGDAATPAGGVLAAADLAFGDLDLDLPQPKGQSVDLPAPLGARARGPGEGVDLPQPKGLSDLPAPRIPEGLEGLDIPTPGLGGSDDFGELDLPAPAAVADLPAPAGLDELRAARGGGVDLPAPAELTDLPSPMSLSDIPSLAATDDGFGALDLPAPVDLADLPGAPEEGLDLDELPSPRASFDDLELPEPPSAPLLGGAGEGIPLDSTVPGVGGRPSLEQELRDSAGRGGVGGTAFGEIALDDDAMEFSGLPEADDELETVSLPPATAVTASREGVGEPRPKAKRKIPVRVIAVLGAFAVLVIGGASLGFTPYGYFGMYFFDRFLPAAGTPEAVARAIDEAEERLALDTFRESRAALVDLGRARRTMGLNRDLLARSLLHQALYTVRFGSERQESARMASLRNRLEERGAASGAQVALAFVADTLRQGNAEAAQRSLGGARRGAGDDAWADILAGEVYLAVGRDDEAYEAFSRGAERGATARGLWGAARIRLRGEDTEAARAAVEAVLSASPRHAGAMVALANLELAAGHVDEAVRLASMVTASSPFAAEGEESGYLWAEPAALASAHAVIGQVEEARGQATRALAAYDRAIEVDSSYVPALVGAGRILLADRPADALARFESVQQTESAATTRMANGRTALTAASLGAARAKLALDRVQDAHDDLTALTEAAPHDAEALLWLGRSEERLDPPNLELAEEHYRAAINEDPQSFTAYLALAEVFLRQERDTDATQTLVLAEERVAESAQMRYELGRFEGRRGHFDEAIAQLARSLELEPDRPPALFALGTAYRQAGRLGEAESILQRLSRLDPEHPGLAMERGLLYEARGQSAEAVEAYRLVLEEQPQNFELLLRLGIAQVGAGQLDDALETLERVRQARPNSAEAQHFLGRVAFAQGTYDEALRYFRSAVGLDPSRAVFHLWVGRAALAASTPQLFAEAIRSAELALDIDPSLGDAHWVRGAILLRSGRPREAVTALQTALELNPYRHEARATLGDAYDEIGRLNEAIQAYRQVTSAVDDNGEWYFRLGQLSMDRGDAAEGVDALTRSTLLGEAVSPRPAWLADAHRLCGDALRLRGSRAEAIPHYRRYLEIAPSTSLDRVDVRRLLLGLGEVP
jgi:predicted Zn finger-like uncharacterized protein